LNKKNGQLKEITTAKNVLNPSFLTLSQNGKYLYACTDTKTPNKGSVSSYEFNPSTKKLTFINSQKTNGENPVYLAVNKNGKWLTTANYNDGSVSVFSINEDGNILSINQFISFKDSSIHKERQKSSHIHSTVFSPNEDFLFLPDLGADKIRCYQFDSNKNQPLIEAEIPFLKSTLGSGPRHFTFHPNGKFGYCIEELSGTINAYKYQNGTLDSIQRISTHTKNYTEDLSSADIHISPDGKYLYASNRGTENNIAIYLIHKNGTLKSIGHQSTFGTIPRNFAIDKNEKYLIVANQKSGNIVVFRRNLKTGLLKKINQNNIVLKNPSCVQIYQY
jgi:6-phosphogluconolactonase (cycloisomerase 2 family)